MHKSRDVSDLHNSAQTWLCREFNFRPDEGQTFKLMHKNQALNTSLSLVDAHITFNAKVYVQVVEKDDVIAVA